MVHFAILAATHHVLAFSLVALLAAEIGVLRTASRATDFARLGSLDRWYGLVAGLLLIVGLGRIFHGESGSDYYTGNPVFWAKMTAFLLVGLLSIVPTLRFIRWNRRLKANATALPSAAEIAAVKPWLTAQAALLAAMPVFAALMARGVGL